MLKPSIASIITHFLIPQKQPESRKNNELAPVLDAIIPNKLVFPLHTERQHTLYPEVAIDQIISSGEIIANTLDKNAPLHAPLSAKVLDITSADDDSQASLPHIKHVEHMILQPITLSKKKTTQENSGQDRQKKSTHPPLVNKEDIGKIHHQLIQSGIVGMGGGGFPTIDKIKLSYDKQVHTVIINLCECEPIISCDQGLVEQHATEIISGIDFLIQCVQAKRATIIIENNKQCAINKLQNLIIDHPLLSLGIIQSIYPSGHENQLVSYLSGQKVHSHQRPYDLGYAVFNVATCYALHRYYHHNEPLTKRLLTISDGNKRVNQWALIGTPVSDLLRAHHIDYDSQVNHLIMGGPMNGKIIDHTNAAVSKNMNCLLVLPKGNLQQINRQHHHSPCIRCGDCVEVCPVDLLPQQLYWFAQAEQHQKAQDNHLFDCIECGNCAFVCPSKIPLVQYYRIQKKQISEKKLSQHQVRKAKERFEKRKVRLEKIKQQHQQKLQQKRLQAQQKLAQKQADSDAKNDPNSSTPPSSAVAIARAKALARKQKMQSNNHLDK